MNILKQSFFLVLAVLSGTALTSCNSNDDNVDAGIEIPGITITDDVDCCSAEEALQVYRFLQTVKIIPELSIVVDGKYNVFAYSKNGTFHTGYNDIYFVATKKETGNYIKNFQITDLKPLMFMTKMKMEHSTPVAPSVEQFNDNYLAVKRGWISFVMNSSEAGSWTVSYNVDVLGKTAALPKTDILVDPLPEGQEWVKSFKVDNETYYISIVNPTDLKTGKNTLQAFVSKKNNPATVPYQLASEKFVIDIDPRMPDMGNHTSPDNEALELKDNGTYEGNVNLTMTGLWRIHFTVKDLKGNVLAGGDDLKDGFSSLYFDVTI